VTSATAGSAPALPKARKRKSGRRNRVQPFDFRRPIKFRREHVRTLELMNETWARQFSTVLSTRLRSVNQVILSSIEQSNYDEYIRGVANPSFIAVVSLHPMQGASMLHIPINVAMACVERLLGGSGTGAQPARQLTDIENALMNDLVQRSLDEMPYAWTSLVADMKPRVVSIESNPQFAQVCAASDMVVVIKFEFHVGLEEDLATLCIPFNSLQPALERHSKEKKFADASEDELARAKQHLRSRMHDVPVEVSVQFDPVRIPAREIYNLQPGDVLSLGHKVQEPLAIFADGVRCYEGVAGRKGKNLACQVTGGAWEDDGNDHRP